jgi:hypothetical protein
MGWGAAPHLAPSEAVSFPLFKCKQEELAPWASQECPLTAGSVPHLPGHLSVARPGWVFNPVRHGSSFPLCIIKWSGFCHDLHCGHRGMVGLGAELRLTPDQAQSRLIAILTTVVDRDIATPAIRSQESPVTEVGSSETCLLPHSARPLRLSCGRNTVCHRDRIVCVLLPASGAKQPASVKICGIFPS